MTLVIQRSIILFIKLKSFKDFTPYPTIEDIYEISVDNGKGTRDLFKIYDTAGLKNSSCKLFNQYFTFADAFILVYDPADSKSLDILAEIKNEIDKNKDKKEVTFHE